MSSIFGLDTSSSANAFADLNRTASSSSGNLLGDYAMIRNGSYKKLLSAYYSKESKSPEESEEVKEENKKLVLAKGDADSLKVTAEKLQKSEFTEENRKGIEKNIKDFVESYNTMIDSSAEVDTKNVLQNTLWMTRTTASNSTLLSEVGIKIGKDNKLSIDEETFSKATMSTLKVLFSGHGSLSSKVVQKAGQVSKNAVAKVVESKGGASYTNKGSTNDMSASAMFDKLF